MAFKLCGWCENDAGIVSLALCCDFIFHSVLNSFDVISSCGCNDRIGVNAVRIYLFLSDLRIKIVQRTQTRASAYGVHNLFFVRVEWREFPSEVVTKIDRNKKRKPFLWFCSAGVELLCVQRARLRTLHTIISEPLIMYSSLLLNYVFAASSSLFSHCAQAFVCLSWNRTTTCCNEWHHRVRMCQINTVYMVVNALQLRQIFFERFNCFSISWFTFFCSLTNGRFSIMIAVAGRASLSETNKFFSFRFVQLRVQASCDLDGCKHRFAECISSGEWETKRWDGKKSSLLP